MTVAPGKFSDETATSLTLHAHPNFAGFSAPSTPAGYADRWRDQGNNESHPRFSHRSNFQ
jgi:hypothetical protein